MARWLLRGGFLLAAIVLPMLFPPAALVMWLLMPAVVECSRELEERYFCIAAIVMLVGSCCVSMSEDVYATAFLWGACGVFMLLWRGKNVMQRSLVWAGLGAAVLCMVLFFAGRQYPEGIFAGLAGEIAGWINSRDNAVSILLQCYEMGYARLEEELQPVMSLFGVVVLTKADRLQLLYSLTYTLEVTLRALAPKAIAAWLILTLVLTAALPDVIRRKKGLPANMPPFWNWQLTPWAGRRLNALAVLYLVSLLFDQPALSLAGSLCAAVFQYAHMVLGLSVMESLTGRFGMAKVLRRLWMIGCIVFAPFVLVILGVADRMFDLRQPRRSTDDEGGYEQ